MYVAPLTDPDDLLRRSFLPTVVSLPERPDAFGSYTPMFLFQGSQVGPEVVQGKSGADRATYTNFGEGS